MMIDGAGGAGGAAGGIASSKATGQDEYRLPTDIKPTVGSHKPITIELQFGADM